MNLAAIQHYSFDNFCYALNDDELVISILTGKDVDRVFIVSGDPFEAGIMGGNWQWHGTEKEITAKKELQNHFRWTTMLRPEFKRLSYYFRILSGTEERFFTYNGFFTKEEFENGGSRHGKFIMPWMNSADTNRTPAWAENAVWYQIFPSRFARGKSDFTPQNLIPWQKYGESIPFSKNHREPVYGGNIQGIIDHLDYLKELGITGIYTTPLNKASSQHKYDTTDYMEIDEEFGTKETMRRFVQEAHARGISVMLDGVFNHSGWFFEKWQDVWKNRENSAYKDWFMVNDFNFTEPAHGHGQGNAGTGKYYSFAFTDFMPKLNTNNKEVRDYIISACRSWVQDYDIDGLRLDVANEISHVFCQELRAAMKALKPEFYIIGEIWHNSMPWLRGTEYDSVMNYPLQNSIADFCAQDKQCVKDFEFAVNRCYSMYYEQTNRVLFNQMDSHDTIRILNRCGKNKTRARQALTLLFAMPGSVCIYYGTEIMLEGGYDPDNRRCMPWNEIEAGMFKDDFAFMQTLIALRKEQGALRSTDYEFIYDKDDAYGKSRILRIAKHAEGETIIVLLNCGTFPDDFATDEAAAAQILLRSPGILVYKTQ